MSPRREARFGSGPMAVALEHTRPRMYPGLGGSEVTRTVLDTILPGPPGWSCVVAIPNAFGSNPPPADADVLHVRIVNPAVHVLFEAHPVVAWGVMWSVTWERDGDAEDDEGLAVWSLLALDRMVVPLCVNVEVVIPEHDEPPGAFWTPAPEACTYRLTPRLPLTPPERAGLASIAVGRYLHRQREQREHDR